MIGMAISASVGILEVGQQQQHYLLRSKDPPHQLFISTDENPVRPLAGIAGVVDRHPK
jgi:hypothetical protein